MAFQRLEPAGPRLLSAPANSLAARRFRLSQRLILISFGPLLSLRLLHPVRIYTGPVFTVMNDSKQKSGRDLLDFGRVRPTVSFTVGAGVVLMRHLLVDLRYNGQFRAKHDVVLPDGQQLDKLRSYNVALSFGYLF